MTKPKGLNAARKLKIPKKSTNKDIGYNQASGIVIERSVFYGAHNHYGRMRGVKVQLFRDSSYVTAFVPGDGGINYIAEQDKVTMIRRNKIVKGIHGVYWIVVKVGDVSLVSLRQKRH
eukprot:TRINITY_DN3928_c0_g1_i5.p1 TRINITY_DN3928_c0_g1~~TRINITY_DN3928_c0_g1_i5.p1  ORF type:complete len:118 (-),score=11.72 TRINITY_DN3928_c0_g1_i5:265-618(-)